jgi:hypothetical protein
MVQGLRRLISLLFGLSEPVNRRQYAIAGLGLMSLKYVVDAVIVYGGTRTVWRHEQREGLGVTRGTAGGLRPPDRTRHRGSAQGVEGADDPSPWNPLFKLLRARGGMGDLEPPASVGCARS